MGSGAGISHTVGMDEAPAFEDITAWFNTDGDVSHPTEIDADVVLLHFWSYTCPDSNDALPRMQELWEHYREHGLTVVGIHTAEFSFEQRPEHVETAVDERDITYPVALDADNTTWHLYGNRHRPRQTVIDRDGHIRHEQVDDRYRTLEDAVRRLLLQAGRTLPDSLFDDTDMAPDEAEQDVNAPVDAMISPRIRAGEDGPALGNVEHQVCHTYARIDYRDERPDEHQMNRLYLKGTWMQTDECITFHGDKGYTALRFTAQDCTVTMAPGDADELRVTVELDGAPVPEGRRGQDVDEDDQGTYVDVSRPCRYQLVERDAVDVGEIRLVPRDTGLRVYACSFS